MAKIPAEKQKICDDLIVDLAFQKGQMMELRADIEENGWYEEYQNGANQHGRKMRVEGDAYLKLQKAYTSTIKQLCDLVPDTGARQDELMDFITRD